MSCPPDRCDTCGFLFLNPVDRVLHNEFGAGVCGYIEGLRHQLAAANEEIARLQAIMDKCLLKDDTTREAAEGGEGE